MPRPLDTEREIAEFKATHGSCPTFTCSNCGKRDFASYRTRPRFAEFSGAVCRKCYNAYIGRRRRECDRTPEWSYSKRRSTWAQVPAQRRYYAARHKAKVDAKREQGVCVYIDCEKPLSERSRHYCDTHLKERTEQQRARRAAQRLEDERTNRSKKEIKELRKALFEAVKYVAVRYYYYPPTEEAYVFSGVLSATYIRDMRRDVEGKVIEWIVKYPPIKRLSQALAEETFHAMSHDGGPFSRGFLAWLKKIETGKVLHALDV